MKKVLSLILTLVLIVCLGSCGVTEAPNLPQNGTDVPEVTQDDTAAGIWKNATYFEDTEFGEGSKTVAVEVKAEGKTVTFTIKTDKDTVGAALLEHNLIAGDESEFGLYIKVVNGITADYDVDQSYWAFYIDGEYAMSGADTTEITEGAVYQLAYTK